MAEGIHAPVHYLEQAGAYMVTASTYRKQHYFRQPARLSFLQDQLFQLAEKHGWQLQAWAIFSNHYHFVALSPSNVDSLKLFIQGFHSITAKEVNRLDGEETRQVWFQYWDTLLTYEKSYLARLNYVHQNPVRHGLVSVASAYPWCSAGWFERTASPAFHKMVSGFKTDRVNVIDDFDVVVEDS
jgi:putative transposase